MIRTVSVLFVAIALMLVVGGCEDHKKNTEQPAGVKITGSVGTGKKSKAVEAALEESPGK